MPPFKPDYEAAIPPSLTGGLALFRSRSTVANVAAVLAGGLGWGIGYAALGADGSTTALAVGSAVCGLVLGIAFTRALGGPALNLVANFVWPFLGAGGTVLLGGLRAERLLEYRTGIALVFPAFFVTLGCMMVWFGLLGSDQMDEWIRRHYPEPFFGDCG